MNLKQIQIINHKIANPHITNKDLAKKFDYTERNVLRILDSEEAKKLINTHIEKSTNDVVSILEKSSEKAANTLISLLDSFNENIKYQASVKILEGLQKLNSKSQIEVSGTLIQKEDLKKLSTSALEELLKVCPSQN